MTLVLHTDDEEPQIKEEEKKTPHIYTQICMVYFMYLYKLECEN